MTCIGKNTYIINFFIDIFKLLKSKMLPGSIIGGKQDIVITRVFLITHSRQTYFLGELNFMVVFLGVSGPSIQAIG